ncbi:Endonuclease-reverse transcriptase [Popillia japonica]|uniref:Endonuclease-reverse transcriptase n=1 Tax=Popillia japonica TaxID=7064 RepID=A0AAW1LAJ7_POPJA
MRVLQINVGRAYAAQDLAYAVANQRNIVILVVSVPNKKRVSGDKWLKDCRVDVAVICLTRNLDVLGHKSTEGHLILNLKNMTIICCYISPNISLQEYKNEVDVIMTSVESPKRVVVLGDFNAKSAQWGSPHTDDKGDYKGPKRRSADLKFEVDWQTFKNTIELIAGNGVDVSHKSGAKLIRLAYKNGIKAGRQRKKVSYWWTDRISSKREECLRTRRILTRLRILVQLRKKCSGEIKRNLASSSTEQKNGFGKNCVSK